MKAYRPDGSENDKKNKELLRRSIGSWPLAVGQTLVLPCTSSVLFFLTSRLPRDKNCHKDPEFLEETANEEILADHRHTFAVYTDQRANRLKTGITQEDWPGAGGRRRFGIGACGSDRVAGGEPCSGGLHCRNKHGRAHWRDVCHGIQPERDSRYRG